MAAREAIPESGLGRAKRGPDLSSALHPWGCNALIAHRERRSYMRQQCAEGYSGNLCASCTRAQDGTRYGFYTAFTCTRCKSNATLVRGGCASFPSATAAFGFRVA